MLGQIVGIFLFLSISYNLFLAKFDHFEQLLTNFRPFLTFFFSEIQEASIETCKGIGDNKAIRVRTTCLELDATSLVIEQGALCCVSL